VAAGVDEKGGYGNEKGLGVGWAKWRFNPSIVKRWRVVAPNICRNAKFFRNAPQKAAKVDARDTEGTTRPR